MQMDRGLDTGPVLAQRSLQIDPSETGGQLHDRLASAGADLLVDTLRAGALPEAVAQPQTGVCYAHKLSKQEAALDFHQPAEQLARQVRAFNPFPVATAQWAGQRLRVFEAQALASQSGEEQAGRLLALGSEGIDVACGQGVLRLLRLQRPGGKPLPVAEFVRGAASMGLAPGVTLE